jgi:two-component system response regulator HydG
MMSAHSSLETAISAKNAGAYYFLRKPFESNDTVVLGVILAAEHRRLAHHARSLEEQLDARKRFDELIGASREMLEVYRIIDGVATTDATVLVLGESGTGKELVARALHVRSLRAAAPMVALNCAAIPKDLVESELFGHVRGAFTGALAARAGVFEAANTGTLFLDEVGDLPLPAQASLLRALQLGEIRRVGSDETKRVDVRVVAATNVDLKSKIDTGAFRKDLFYRLNVIAVRVPALRDRGDDVLLLADHFLGKLARKLQREAKELAPDARQALREYDWPGNVRELEHALEHAFILSRGRVIGAADLPFQASPGQRGGVPARVAPVTDCPGSADISLSSSLLQLPYAEAKKRAQASFDEAYLAAVMERAGGNLSEAARQAGLDRSNFRRMTRKPRVE